MYFRSSLPGPSILENNFLNTTTKSAYDLQRSMDSISPRENLVARIVGGSLSAVADVFVDTLKTPMQSLEHAKNAVVQLFYARTSGQGHKEVTYNGTIRSINTIHDPSKYSIKGSLFYTQEAVSQAIFTVPTILLAPLKLVHQLGGHFFYNGQTYSIGLARTTEDFLPAWGLDPVNKTDANKKCAKWQDDLYSDVREDSSPLASRILSPLIAFIDVALDTVSPLAETVRTVCLTVGHLFGALTWQKNCSLRGVIVRTDLAFFRASQTISAIVFMLPKFLQKTCAILYDPEHAYSIRAFSSPENVEEISGLENQGTIELRYV